ncbi:hypothetical protein [Mesorhizobium sp. CO1-1-9]|uniref:hypothetical protein n=1 Tax=Mesorhizobium sp. CO1-1-9 TaxID=2876630 RepID=UPI001CCAB40A|nr:hypothetical protein [Mesorhizobium sp. CO1-1-9]MBZ9693913.1 hypothetical protein [Mesorhizobium sp. CO1-1-9]
MRAASQKSAESADLVIAAATWLATGGADKAHAVLPQICKRFSLSIADAIAAERQANLIRARAH